MKYLSKFSPAETLLVLHDKNASIKELLKVTFMDLLLKQVVRTFEVERQANKKDAIRVYKYVEVGKNFLTYRALPHENAFLSPFQKSNRVQILFRHVVKMGYQNSKSESNYQNILVKSPNLDNCFESNMIQVFFGGFNISTEGLELRSKVQIEIGRLEKELPLLIKNDHQKALSILKAIKGNIFLLTNIEFSLLQEIDKELLTEMNRQDSKGNRSGCSGCTWDSFDNYSESFDSSCSGDSGCSSSSGCSGCGGSGCGGD